MWNEVIRVYTRQRLEVLPADVLLEVPYAELVADPETWSRRIIDFVGLEWDPRCLEFRRTLRSVVTASNWKPGHRNDCYYVVAGASSSTRTLRIRPPTSARSRNVLDGADSRADRATLLRPSP